MNVIRNDKRWIACDGVSHLVHESSANGAAFTCCRKLVKGYLFRASKRAVRDKCEDCAAVSDYIPDKSSGGSRKPGIRVVHDTRQGGR